MWRRSSSRRVSAADEGPVTYRKEGADDALESAFKQLKTVKPLYSVQEPAMWAVAQDHLLESAAAHMVDGTPARAATEELARLIHDIDDSVSCGQRDIQIQVQHIQEHIDSHANAISSAVEEIAAARSLVSDGGTTAMKLDTRVRSLEERVRGIQEQVQALELDHRKRLESMPVPAGCLPVSTNANSGSMSALPAADLSP